MNDRVEALTKAARENPELLAALRAATTPQDVVAAAAAHGLTITEADVAESRAEDLTDADLSDAELEASNAGGNTFGDCMTVVHCGTWFGLC